MKKMGKWKKERKTWNKGKTEKSGKRGKEKTKEKNVESGEGCGERCEKGGSVREQWSGEGWWRGQHPKRTHANTEHGGEGGRLL
jgi:hypothetical protein